MTGSEWIAAYAAALGVPAPSDEEVERILRLAGVAAHASERTAAPVATHLVGLAGVPMERALELAEGIAPVG